MITIFRVMTKKDEMNGYSLLFPASSLKSIDLKVGSEGFFKFGEVESAFFLVF